MATTQASPIKPACHDKAARGPDGPARPCLILSGSCCFVAFAAGVRRGFRSRAGVNEVDRSVFPGSSSE